LPPLLGTRRRRTATSWLGAIEVDAIEVDAIEVDCPNCTCIFDVEAASAVDCEPVGKTNASKPIAADIIKVNRLNIRLTA
jgi:hypothetical protein